ncbi:hypothetical protein GXW82_33720 [Streptacidiphilus sp. 4-A2]|nr:hypothetical protein [Streptacidiphilus sp. 4-A2]
MWKLVGPGGVHWLAAFTSPDALKRFVLKWGAVDGQVVEFVTVYCWRLLDEATVKVGGAVGLAVDLGSDQPVLLPPVTGIVPQEVAVAWRAVTTGAARWIWMRCGRRRLGSRVRSTHSRASEPASRRR